MATKFDITLHILVETDDPQHPENITSALIDKVNFGVEGIKGAYGNVKRISDEAAAKKYTVTPTDNSDD